MANLRLGTRASKLALAQSGIIADLLRVRGHAISLVEISTAGDRDQSTPLAEGVGWFTTALQEALLDGRIDIAVHSYKDLPTKEPAGLAIAAAPLRADAHDALVSRSRLGLAALPAGARIGTSSPRRESQLRAARPEAIILPIRGNVDTRVAKLDAGDYDAIVLAAAGLVRLGLEHRISERLAFDVMLPAPAQGALAVECRADDASTRAILAAIDDPTVHCTVRAERAFLATLEAGCSSPAAAHATIEDGMLVIEALVEREGRHVRTRAEGRPEAASALGRQAALELLG